MSPPPRLWKKVWGQVPSPQKFFQPLYVGHSGDFKVSARPPLPRLRSLCPLGAELHRPRTPAAPCRPQPGLRAPHLQSAGNNPGGGRTGIRMTQNQAASPNPDVVVWGRGRAGWSLEPQTGLLVLCQKPWEGGRDGAGSGKGVDGPTCKLHPCRAPTTHHQRAPTVVCAHLPLNTHPAWEGPPQRGCGDWWGQGRGQPAHSSRAWMSGNADQSPAELLLCPALHRAPSAFCPFHPDRPPPPREELLHHPQGTLGRRRLRAGSRGAAWTPPPRERDFPASSVPFRKLRDHNDLVFTSPMLTDGVPGTLRGASEM